MAIGGLQGFLNWIKLKGSDGTIIGNVLDSVKVIRPNKSATGSLEALNATVDFTANDMGSFIAQISGTWSGTIKFFGSIDGGTTFSTELFAILVPGTLGSSFTANGVYRLINPSGFNIVRAQMTSYTSGTANLTLNSSSPASTIMAYQTVYANFLGQMKITGNTDLTLIGNVADSLKTMDRTILYWLSQGRVFSYGIGLNMASSGSNNPLLLLRNPAASGRILRIVRMFAGVNINNIQAEFLAFLNPTVTANGTSHTPTNRKAGDSTTAVGLLNSLPTISANGSPINAIASGQNTNSNALSHALSLEIRENTSLLITGSPASNNRAATLDIEWMEVTA